MSWMVILNRWPGKCGECGEPTFKDEAIAYNKKTRQGWHYECWKTNGDKI